MKKLFASLPVIVLGTAILYADTGSKDKKQSPQAETGMKETTFLDRFKQAPYKPVYYLQGGNDAKFQIAFNYQIISGIDLYLGYSQLILWDIYSYSSPFLDFNMRPEFYYLKRINNTFLESIEIGLWEHISNGYGDDRSRSIDMSYIRLNHRTRYGSWIFALKLKIYLLYRPGYYSEKIGEYMGWWKTTISITKKFRHYLQRLEFYATAFPGDRLGYDFTRGAQEAGLKIQFQRWDPYLYMQFYHGNMETILYFDRIHTDFRFGFLLEL